MRVLILIFVSALAFGQENLAGGGGGAIAVPMPTMPTTAPALTDAQVRTVREAQLAVSQAEVAREKAKVAYYEAELRFKAAQDELVSAVAKIPRPDGCPLCVVNGNTMKWEVPKKEK